MRKLRTRLIAKQLKPDETEWGAVSIFHTEIIKLYFCLLQGTFINEGNFQIQEIVFLLFYNPGS